MARSHVFGGGGPVLALVGDRTAIVVGGPEIGMLAENVVEHEEGFVVTIGANVLGGEIGLGDRIIRGDSDATLIDGNVVVPEIDLGE